MQVYQILKSLQEALDGFCQIEKVNLIPAGEFFRTDHIEISGKTKEGKKFELTFEVEEDRMKVSEND